MHHDTLRDIKPLLEIPEVTVYFYFGVVVFLLFSIILFYAFFKYKHFFLKQNDNKRKKYFEQLKSIDWSSSKKSAYDVTFLGRKLAIEEDSKKVYTQLLILLEPYKYKKEVPPVDDKTLKQYQLFVETVAKLI